ncbi:hypothetical protein Bca52824_035178 [Brassica carinata]|uniref:Uncharacterized protein n=1 Tax=Brassica carinata TaxID=52824 RepID=A0A8X7S358_BRACI|nr:hypothetical protein Bca52824_035178 [Brassica carinata]
MARFIDSFHIIHGYGSFKWFCRSLYRGYYKNRHSRSIRVQNLWMYVFGMAFSGVAIGIQDFDAIANNGIVVSMVMEYAYNIVKGSYGEGGRASEDEFFNADTIFTGLRNVHQLVVIEEGPEIRMQCALELENSIDTELALEVVTWSVIFWCIIVAGMVHLETFW